MTPALRTIAIASLFLFGCSNQKADEPKNSQGEPAAEIIKMADKRIAESKLQKENIEAKYKADMEEGLNAIAETVKIRRLNMEEIIRLRRNSLANSEELVASLSKILKLKRKLYVMEFAEKEGKEWRGIYNAYENGDEDLQKAINAAVPPGEDLQKAAADVVSIKQEIEMFEAKLEAMTPNPSEGQAGP